MEGNLIFSGFYLVFFIYFAVFNIDLAVVFLYVMVSWVSKALNSLFYSTYSFTRFSIGRHPVEKRNG